MRCCSSRLFTLLLVLSLGSCLVGYYSWTADATIRTIRIHPQERTIVHELKADPQERTTVHQLRAHPQERAIVQTVQSVPRIIHQTWKTKEVPGVVASWIKSWTMYHPEWEYWFWTDEDARTFISKRYPGFLALYDSYESNIHRADVMRYFILYEFGGVYADMDVEALRPLDELLKVKTCTVSQEPELHAYLIHSRAETFACNALMACRPKHPFFRLVIEALSYYSKVPGVLFTTGPFMLDSALSFFEDRYKPSIPQDTVWKAPPKVFMPTYDEYLRKIAMKKCVNVLKQTINNKLVVLQKRLLRRQEELCKSLASSGYKNNILPTSYTVHHWMHTWYDYGDKYGHKKSTLISISSIIPNVVSSDIFLTRYAAVDHWDRPLKPADKNSRLSRLMLQ